MLARLAVAPRTEEAAADGAGNLYFGSDFGQLRVRHQDGTWGSIDTGTLDEVSAVDADGERIVAGTLHGLLLTSADRGQSWQRVRALDRNEIVMDIARAGGTWMVLTARTGKGVNPWGPIQQLRAYAAKREDLEDLAAARDFPVSLPFARILGRSDSLVSQVVGGAYMVNTVADLLKLDSGPRCHGRPILWTRSTSSTTAPSSPRCASWGPSRRSASRRTQA
jgi:hypothetical protein